MNGRRYILAGGGTSGHVNPALAIAREIQREEPEADIRFFGTARGIEHELVTRAGYAFTAIQARPLPSRLSLDLIKALAAFWNGRQQCRHLLQDLQPHAVIGTGGYVCSPVVAAAASLKIPVLLHEQNAFPGRSNRLMAKRSQAVCVAFPGTEKHFHRQVSVTVTGNPVLPAFFGQDRGEIRRKLHPDDERPLILVMGGSLGARTINQTILGLDPWIRQRQQENLPAPRIILAAGSRQYEAVAASGAPHSDWLEVKEYLYDIHEYYAAADLLICRSGALTCSEIAASGRPSILIPYPFAAGDHQTYNAKILVDAGAALFCPDNQLSAVWLADRLTELLSDPDQLESMGKQALILARPDAAATIYSRLTEIIRS
ncbi:MAG: undecaprenyldiphospho-muramoylpentapeptide beta-N-acetylglucosaminyltransferase [Bacillota bacterium]|nr:undecaprenyldiphospho-muramoylpentapeptide beta-N-acetylglucosaminyltransferase [Bacillota bacterium]